MHFPSQLLNAWGDRWADYAWAGLWQSSALIAALWIIDGFLQHRMRPVVRQALWMLVLLKLLLPTSLALPTGVGYWIPRGTGENQGRFDRWVAREIPNSRANPPAGPSARAPAAQPPVTPRPTALLMLAWMAGVVAFGAVVARRSFAWQQGQRPGADRLDPLALQLEASRAEVGLSSRVALRWIAAGQSPALCGLWRPTLLLPRGLDERLSPDQLRAVFLHELVHARRGDVWVNALQVGLQILWWWHPLLWLANARLRAIREEVVDDEVAFRMGPESTAYPEALLEVAKAALLRPGLSLGLLGIVESRSALRGRIERMFADPPARMPRLGGWGFATTVLAGLLLLPMARGRATPQAAGLEPRPPLSVVTAATTNLLREPTPEAAAATGSELVTRTYRLDYATMMPALEKRLGRTLGDDFAEWSAAFRQALEASGFSMQPPNAMFLTARTARLMVRGPADQLARVDKVLADLASQPPQVLIEARFLEVTEAAFHALPLAGIRAPGKDPLDPDRLQALTESQYRSLLEAVKRRADVSTLAAPRLTTLSGRSAEIRTSASDTNAPASLSVAVRPEVQADNAMIRLETRVEWTQLAAFPATGAATGPVEPGSKSGSPETSGVVLAPAVQGYVSRSVTNTIVLGDSCAQVLGDLGEEQPAGRKRVIVLVVPTMIDAAGNRYRAERP